MEHNTNFHIVGIGASAGGLSAFQSFFSGIPSKQNTGMAFVLIQHLSPEHKSLLTELIQHYTEMPVCEAEDGMIVMPDCVYIIPPRKDLALINGKLILTEISEKRGTHRPIDFFFTSLAHAKGSKAICVILSGTGNDGSLGLKEISENGGLVLVQETNSAEYDGMPLSAIETGLVDFILLPSEMAEKIDNYTNKETTKMNSKVINSDIIEAMIINIFALLHSNTGHDFSLYKRNTILRRIDRRMGINHIENICDYYIYLKNNQKETELLFHDMLIGVTNFFRDSTTFISLEKAIEKLFNEKSLNETLRIWIAGCSTGEEAYSIAILFYENFEKYSKKFPIQIFATDIDSQSLVIARNGSYPLSISVDVSKERLDNFFILTENTYKIKKIIRDSVIFSEQNYIKDPPFSKLDLISCRNSLIYMTAELQRKVFPVFYYALNTGGYLFLGTSESIGEFENLFEETDRKNKLYQKKDGVKINNFINTSYLIDSKLNFITPKPSETIIEKDMNHEELAVQEVLRQYSLSFVIVNELKQILYVNGRTGKYLETAQGKSNFNIINMAREGLEQELTTALHKVITTNIGFIACNNLRVKTNGDFTNVNLKVTKLGKGFYLIIFEDVLSFTTNNILKTEIINDVNIQIAEYIKELNAKDEYLRAIREDMEATNEEMKASNEEMQSVNEELQSTNEELGTSKEELQSLNEELSTVNNELQIKIADLQQVSNDMNNLMIATGVGTIFVDHQLNIQRFTPNIAKVVNLIKTDVGRPLEHSVSNLVGYTSLIEDVQSVLDTLIPKEVEVQSKSGINYLLRILPYRTLVNVIEGAVITFVDITEIKKANKIFKENEELKNMAAIVRDSKDAFVTQNIKGDILSWNPGAEKLYGWSEAEAIKMNISEIIPESLREESIKTIKELSKTDLIKPYFTKRISKNGSIVDVCLTSTALINEKNEIYAISTIERIRSDIND